MQTDFTESTLLEESLAQINKTQEKRASPKSCIAVKLVPSRFIQLRFRRERGESQECTAEVPQQQRAARRHHTKPGRWINKCQTTAADFELDAVSGQRNPLSTAQV
mmetsp:Transcript_12423/g.37898  ORF Transcript_12423/g.37898 Transcript_12423/m.37898 type:complete len:106 (+) Transcript_12423:964-1281(+)